MVNGWLSAQRKHVISHYFMLCTKLLQYMTGNIKYYTHTHKSMSHKYFRKKNKVQYIVECIFYG